MIRRPPRSTRTDTLFPYTTLFRSIRQLKTESAGGLPYRVMSRQNPDLAEQDDIVGIIPSEIRFQVAAAPEMAVVFKNIVSGSAHRVVLLWACVTRRDIACPRRAASRFMRGKRNMRSEEGRVGNECVRK